MAGRIEGDVAFSVSVPERGFVALIHHYVQRRIAKWQIVSVPERGFVALILVFVEISSDVGQTGEAMFQSPSGDSWL
jgi:hypothetical protein